MSVQTTKDEYIAHGKLFAYMTGWIHGAGCKSFTNAQMANEDWKAGWIDGKEARRAANEAAEKQYGAKLSIIREMKSPPLYEGQP